MIIDVRAHYHPRAYNEALARAGVVRAGGGGPIPMLLQRLDNQFSMRQRGLPEPPSVTARRFSYDTVGHGSHAALTCAWKAFGADHILPGSDFPVLLSYETYERTFSWIREVGLPEADIDQILERTAPSVSHLG